MNFKKILFNIDDLNCDYTRIIKNFLLSICDLEIIIEDLKSGTFKDVSGKIFFKRNEN